MMIIEHKPEPVVVPPTTYDLIGLSGEEIRMLRYFAERVTLTAAATNARLPPDVTTAAQRFLDKTNSIPVAYWSPKECFK